MKVIVDSTEYRAWHEVGHATICLHLGGDVEFIELLTDDARGHARARCIDTPEIERSVACGGFAAEFYLLDKGLAERARGDDRDLSQIVFHNAFFDRGAFWGREVGPNDEFSRSEDEQFMQHAISHVAPIFDQYFPGMQAVVRELCEARVIEGRRLKALLRPTAREREHGPLGRATNPYRWSVGSRTDQHGIGRNLEAARPSTTFRRSAFSAACRSTQSVRIAPAPRTTPPAATHLSGRR